MMLFISIRASFAGLEFLRKAFIRLDKAIGLWIALLFHF